MDRFGIADKLPAPLQELPKFRNEKLDPARCGGDICIQACADDPQVAVHAIRNLARLGLARLPGITTDAAHIPAVPAEGAYGRLKEVSPGKDTSTGHWEFMGVQLQHAFQVFPDGFPEEVMDRFDAATGRGHLCNKPYSGTDVIRDFGPEHLRTGAPIVYTSADSVFQIAV